MLLLNKNFLIWRELIYEQNNFRGKVPKLRTLVIQA